MRSRDGKGIDTVLRPVVYDVFRPDPSLIGQLYDVVRCRLEGSRVLAMGYDASSRASDGGGPRAYSCATIVFHRRGYREIAYRRGARSGVHLVGDGRVSLIPAGYALEVDYREPCEGLVIGIADGMLGQVAEELGLSGDFPMRFGVADPALESMSESFWRSGAASGRFLDALGRAMVLHVLERYANQPVGPDPEPEWLKRTIDHARRHLHRPIALEELADAAGLSRAHFAPVQARDRPLPARLPRQGPDRSGQGADPGGSRTLAGRRGERGGLLRPESPDRPLSPGLRDDPGGLPQAAARSSQGIARLSKTPSAAGPTVRPV